MTEPQPQNAKRGPITRILFAILRTILTVLILIDEIARPLYRPLIAWVASLEIVARMERWIARQPRLAPRLQSRFVA